MPTPPHPKTAATCKENKRNGMDSIKILIRDMGRDKHLKRERAETDPSDKLKN